MQAVCGRAYMAALSILEAALKVRDICQSQTDICASTAATPTAGTSARSASSSMASTSAGGQQVLMSMLYPAGSSLDNSPLHVLCANDTCSFTWTGADHINQVREQTGWLLESHHHIIFISVIMSIIHSVCINTRLVLSICSLSCELGLSFPQVDTTV